MMRILQVSTTDTGGGARRVAQMLFAAYAEKELVSYLAVGQKTSNQDGIIQIPNNRMRHPWPRLFYTFENWAIQKNFRIVPRLARWLAYLGELDRFRAKLAGLEDFNFPSTVGLLGLPPQPPDILHIHNMHGSYFDLRELINFSHQLPTVLTLHDAWLFSGHCAHSLNCERWMSGCGHCLRQKEFSGAWFYLVEGFRNNPFWIIRFLKHVVVYPIRKKEGIFYQSP